MQGRRLSDSDYSHSLLDMLRGLFPFRMSNLRESLAAYADRPLEHGKCSSHTGGLKFYLLISDFLFIHHY